MSEIAHKYTDCTRKKLERKYLDEMNSMSTVAKIWTRKENDCYVARVQNDRARK
jgi:hypothetical protein